VTVALVVIVALAAPSGSELPVAGIQMIGQLLLEDLLQDGLHALADPGLHVALHVMLELVLLRGQVPPSSLNPQTTRHHHAKNRAEPIRNVALLVRRACKTRSKSGEYGSVLALPAFVGGRHTRTISITPSLSRLGRKIRLRFEA
jgi:hypothetical protein